MMSLDVHPQVLRALITVLETGSLSAAAERLGYTQSALSKQIANLEERAGTLLVERRSRGVVPTEAGRRLALRAASVLDQLDAAERELKTTALPVEGTARIGGFPTTAMQLVPTAIADLKLLHPWIDVEFVESSTPTQIRRLRSGRLDLGIIAIGEDLPEIATGDLHLEQLPAGALRIAVSARHNLAGRASVSVTDLRNEAWIAGRGAPGDPQFGAWPTLPEPRIVMRLAGWPARLGFVAAGLGITTVPALLKNALPPGVVTVEIDDPTVSRRRMVLASAKPLMPAAAALRDAIHRAAAQLEQPVT